MADRMTLTAALDLIRDLQGQLVGDLDEQESEALFMVLRAAALHAALAVVLRRILDSTEGIHLTDRDEAEALLHD